VIGFGNIDQRIEVGQDPAILIKIEAFDSGDGILPSDEINEALSGGDGESLLFLAIGIILFGLHLSTIVSIRSYLVLDHLTIPLKDDSARIPIIDLHNTGDQRAPLKCEKGELIRINSLKDGDGITAIKAGTGSSISAAEDRKTGEDAGHLLSLLKISLDPSK
jgi:hypothetical protein